MSRRIKFRAHAIGRMFEWSVTPESIQGIIESGEMIKEYPDDRPYPSRLILGWDRQRPLHVVVADNRADDEWIVVTVYEPDPALWEPGFKRRKAR